MVEFETKASPANAGGSLSPKIPYPPKLVERRRTIIRKNRGYARAAQRALEVYWNPHSASMQLQRLILQHLPYIAAQRRLDSLDPLTRQLHFLSRPNTYLDHLRRFDGIRRNGEHPRSLQTNLPQVLLPHLGRFLDDWLYSPYAVTIFDTHSRNFPFYSLHRYAFNEIRPFHRHPVIFITAHKKHTGILEVLNPFPFSFMVALSSTLSRATSAAAITLLLAGSLFFYAAPLADAAKNQQINISGSASSNSVVTIGASSGNNTVVRQRGRGNKSSFSISRSRTSVFSTSISNGFNIFNIWQF